MVNHPPAQATTSGSNMLPTSLEELQQEFSMVVQCLFKLGGGMATPQEIGHAQQELVNLPRRCPYYGLLLLHISLYAYVPFRSEFCVRSSDVNSVIHIPLNQIIEREPQLKNMILNPAMRQLAAVLLKGYVKTYWTTITHNPIKQQFKETLPMGLMTENVEGNTPASFLSKINTAFGMSIAEVAEHEFPEEWGNLIEILIGIYEKGLTNQLHFSQSLGALKCLSLVSQHFSDKHTVVVFPVLVPYMLNVAGNVQLPENIRAKALTVCSEMFNLIAMVSGEPVEEDDDVYVDDDVDGDFDNQNEGSNAAEQISTEAKAMLTKVLEPTLNLIVNEISKPIVNPDSDCAYKMECCKTMNILVKEFGKTLEQAVIHVMQSTCISLEKEFEIYMKHAVLPPNESGLSENLITEKFDSEGESINFTTVICQQVELLATIVCNPKLASLLSSNQSNLVQLIYLLLGYAQLPQSLMEMWDTDPEQFVYEEDNQYSSYSIRTACLKLLEDFNESYEYLAVKSLLEAYNKRMQESQNLYQQNPKLSTWWKLREACLMSISSFTEFRELIEQEPKMFDLPALVSQLLQNDLNVSTEDFPFLKSRAIQCSSYFLSQITNTEIYKVNGVDMVKQLLFIYANHLNPQKEPLAIRLYACQAAARVFCLEKSLLDTVISSIPNKDEILQSILVGMCQIVNEIGDDVMYIPLESIAVFVNVSFDKSIGSHFSVLTTNCCSTRRHSYFHHAKPT